MKLLGALMHRRPDPEQAEALGHVLELARAWERGELGLDGVRALSSGHDRWQAMRCAALGSAEKRLLMSLADALVREQADPQVMHHDRSCVIWIARSDLHSGSVKRTATADDAIVYVWPMHHLEGAPAYPLSHLPREQERQDREQGMIRAYTAYREKRRKRGGS